ncbi:hypothetical protein F4801DRAFT_454078 [Xylaria longipes]|nr:hypothetical protein F4801DRAFT_454078 [Xylaria longipes]
MFFHSSFKSYISCGNSYALTTPPGWGPVEIIPAATFSLVATCYAVQKEVPVSSTNNVHSVVVGISSLLPSISHGLLLVSCLGFGCCVSLYRYRTWEREPYQGIIFLVWIAWVGLVGLGVGREIDTVLVAMVPWALIAAMLTSYFGHASAQRPLSRKFDG